MERTTEITSARLIACHDKVFDELLLSGRTHLPGLTVKVSERRVVEPNSASDPVWLERHKPELNAFQLADVEMKTRMSAGRVEVAHLLRVQVALPVRS